MKSGKYHFRYSFKDDFSVRYNHEDGGFEFVFPVYTRSGEELRLVRFADLREARRFYRWMGETITRLPAEPER